jgi:hypothetical protein
MNSSCAFLFFITLSLLCCAGSRARSSGYEEYAAEWAGQQRARFATYHYEGSTDFPTRGHVSDRPLEWSRNLGLSGENIPVDAFLSATGEGRVAKHVVIFVHGYGAPSLLGGKHIDLVAPFFTSMHSPPHETGTTAWFDVGQAPGGDGPKLYPYLRFAEVTAGFDPEEWAILAVTLNILPDLGLGLSILENADRLRALMDVFWEEEHPWIRSLAFVSHSTGSPVVKSVLGERGTIYANQHPWIQYVDDHINLAGALGGTPSVLLDRIAMGRGLGQQLLYGIQHPEDHLNVLLRYTAEQSVGPPFRKKRTYRWPNHINVLSVAGVWLGGPILGAPILPGINSWEAVADGNPFSGNVQYPIPNGMTLHPLLGMMAYLGKFDGVVSNMGVLERIRYRRLPLPWVDQTDPADFDAIQWNPLWVLPSLSTVDGGGKADSTGIQHGNNAPASDTNKGQAITYVEVNAEHNGMLHNEHLLRLIKRRLGAVTVEPHVQRPELIHMSATQGALSGGNVVVLTGRNLGFVQHVRFGNSATVNFTRVASDQLQVTVPQGTTPGPVAVHIVNTAGESWVTQPAINNYTYMGMLASPQITPPGGQFDEPILIELTSPDGGAIYHSWTHPEPGPDRPGSILYTGPFSIPVNPFVETSSFPLRVRAYREHHFPSETVVATFGSQLVADPPVIQFSIPNLPDGTAQVVLTTTTPISGEGFAPLIFYTVNGADPDLNAPIYSGPISLGLGRHTFKARAFQWGMGISAVSSAEYTVYDPANAVSAPVIRPFSSQAFAKPITVVMENYTEGSTIRYTVGIGSLPQDPTETGPGAISYTEPFVWNPAGFNIFIKARAYKEGQAPSAIVQTGMLTRNEPLAQAGEPVGHARLLEADLRLAVPDGWDGHDGGGNGLFVSGAQAGFRLDHPDDYVMSGPIDLTPFAQARFQVDIQRSGAGGGPVLRVDVSEDDGVTWAHASLLGTVPTTAYAQQTFYFENADGPVRFRLSRVNTSGESVSGLSELRIRDLTWDVELIPDPAGDIRFSRSVRIFLDSFTPHPSQSGQSLATHMIYTTDGSTPDYSLPLHAAQQRYLGGGFVVDRTTTVSAMAYNGEFLTDSPVATWQLRFVCDEPTLHVDKGYGFDEATVTLSSELSGASIRYTLDGTTPISSSPVFSEPISFGVGTHTLAARVFKDGYEPGEPVFQTFTVAPAVAPVIVISPANSRMIEGANLVLHGLAFGQPAPEYQWYLNDDPLPDGNKLDWTIENATPESHGGTYHFVARNVAGEIKSELAFVEVEPEFETPQILVHPEDQTLPEFSTVTLSVVATGLPEPEYQWFHNGLLVEGAVQSHFDIPSLEEAVAGTYHVRVENALGFDESMTAVITVVPLSAPMIRNDPVQIVEVVQGETVVLSLEIDDESAVFFTWLFEEEALLFEVGATLTLSDVGPADVGMYEGIAQNLAGHDRVAFQLVLIEPVISPTYMDWASSFELDPLSDGAPEIDNDGDGRTNLEEFAFGTDPTVPDGPPVRVESIEAGIRMVWLQHPDLAYEALSGSALGAVFEPVTVVEAGTADVQAPYQRFEVVLPFAEHEQFFVVIRALFEQ